MNLNQFRLINNNATTGFKLQGSSVKSLVVKELTRRVERWEYVMLSRVSTMNGLYLEERICEDPEYYRLDSSPLAMLHDLQRVACKSVNEQDILDYQQDTMEQNNNSLHQPNK